MNVIVQCIPCIRAQRTIEYFRKKIAISYMPSGKRVITLFFEDTGR